MSEPKIILIQGGQTGCDRGAARAALDLGAPLEGWMPHDARDEDGPIPEEIARHLRPCQRKGPAARTQRNVEEASALLVIIWQRKLRYASPGTRLTLRLWHDKQTREPRRYYPDLTVTPFNSDRTVVNWIIPKLTALGTPLKLMVAGPRASKWAEGEETAYEFVKAICEAARG